MRALAPAGRVSPYRSIFSLPWPNSPRPLKHLVCSGGSILRVLSCVTHYTGLISKVCLHPLQYPLRLAFFLRDKLREFLLQFLLCCFELRSGLWLGLRINPVNSF